jgi:hypothetical protein
MNNDTVLGWTVASVVVVLWLVVVSGDRHKSATTGLISITPEDMPIDPQGWEDPLLNVGCEILGQQGDTGGTEYV